MAGPVKALSLLCPSQQPHAPIEMAQQLANKMAIGNFISAAILVIQTHHLQANSGLAHAEALQAYIAQRLKT